MCVGWSSGSSQSRRRRSIWARASRTSRRRRTSTPRSAASPSRTTCSTNTRARLCAHAHSALLCSYAFASTSLHPSLFICNLSCVDSLSILSFHYSVFLRLCSLQGHQRLVEAIAKVYSERLGHRINPLTEVLVSVGGYGSLYYITQALLNPGDEALNLFL